MNLARKAGVLLHPTSFKSPYGIGDLGRGAYEFIDILESADQSIWQILPLGPTSFGDSPYQSFSTFAGNTILISPELLVKNGLLSQSQIIPPSFSQSKVEYDKVIKFKSSIFRHAFKNFTINDSYTKFCKESPWLFDYALFTALKSYFIKDRKQNGKDHNYVKYKKLNKQFMDDSLIDDCYFGATWSSWPEDILKRDTQSIKKYTSLLQENIDYEMFLQYEFFRQWDLLRKYTNRKGIEIIGDIPIFVSTDSSDVWANKSLFLLDDNGNPEVIAGVPPDYFSEEGQLWGNPLYDWQAHRKTNFEWWCSRVKACLKTVDTIRLDHFRGFESYWAVKFGSINAKKGTWEKGIGKELFEAIYSSIGSLPIIAEDLGIITPKVEALRDELKLPGMKILQFAFGDNSKNLYLPHNFKSKNCVVYTGTHDNDTTIGWYQSAPENERDHFRRYLNTSGENPAWDMIRLAYSSIAAYCIIPIQDILSENTQYRMNTPGEKNDNWQYRLEKELTQDDINHLRYLVKIYNRSLVKPDHSLSVRTNY